MFPFGDAAFEFVDLVKASFVEHLGAFMATVSGAAIDRYGLGFVQLLYLILKIGIKDQILGAFDVFFPELLHGTHIDELDLIQRFELFHFFGRNQTMTFTDILRLLWRLATEDQTGQEEDDQIITVFHKDFSIR